MSESAAAALDPRHSTHRVLVNTRKYFRISLGPTFTARQVGAACLHVQSSSDNDLGVQLEIVSN